MPTSGRQVDRHPDKKGLDQKCWSAGRAVTLKICRKLRASQRVCPKLRCPHPSERRSRRLHWERMPSGSVDVPNCEGSQTRPQTGQPVFRRFPIEPPLRLSLAFVSCRFLPVFSSWSRLFRGKWKSKRLFSLVGPELAAPWQHVLVLRGGP